MAITQFDFTMPNRLQPQAEFDALLAKLIARWPTWNSEVNATEANMNSLAAAVALQSAAAVNAMSSVLSVANTAKWVAGTNYAQGVTTWSPTDFLSYRRKVAGVSATDPSLDPAGWALVVDNRPYWRQTSVGAISASQTLDANSANILEYTPSVANLSIILQDATTLKLGPATQLISNLGKVDLAVRDKVGNLLCVLGPGGFVTLALKKQTSAAGEWSASGNGIKYVLAVFENFGLGTVSHPGGGARAYIKMSESVAVFIGRSVGTCYLQAMDFSTMTLGAAVAVTGFDTNSQFAGRIAGFAVSATAGAVFAMNINSALYALGFTLSGTAITAGSVGSKALNPNMQLPFDAFQRHVAQIGNSFVFGICFTNANPFKPGFLVCQVVGTAITWGNPVDSGLTVGSTTVVVHCIVPVWTDRVAVLAAGNSGVGVSMATISGLTVSNIVNTPLNAAVTSNGGHKLYGFQPTETLLHEYRGLYLMNSEAVGIRVRMPDAATITLNMNVLPLVNANASAMHAMEDGYVPENHGMFGPAMQGGAFAFFVLPSSSDFHLYRMGFSGGVIGAGVAGINVVPGFTPNGPESHRPPFVAGTAPEGCYLALMRGHSSGSLIPVPSHAALLDLNLRATNTPQARATFPINLFSDPSVPLYNDHEVSYRNNKAHFFVTTGRPSANKYPEMVSFDITTGQVLARHRMNRIASSGAQGGYAGTPSRSMFTMGAGAFSVSIENNTVTVLEMAI